MFMSSSPNPYELERPIGWESLPNWEDESNENSPPHEDGQNFNFATSPNLSTKNIKDHQGKTNLIKFSYDKKVNSIISIYLGNVSKIRCSAFIVSVRSTHSIDRSAEKIHHKAGPLIQSRLMSRKWRMGEPILTSGYDLSPSSLIHVLPPQYNSQWPLASENMLNKSYRNALEIAIENSCRTVVICPLLMELSEFNNNLETKNSKPWTKTEKKERTRRNRKYPAKFQLIDNFHVELRTVRKFLEKWGNHFERIILGFHSKKLFSLCHSLLPLYFPRSIKESILAIEQLPRELGDENGEYSIEERRIRIKAYPEAPETYENSSDDPVYNRFEGAKVVGASPPSISRKIPDPDSIKKPLKYRSPAEKETIKYITMIQAYKKLKKTNFRLLHYIYSIGIDSIGRKIIIFDGSKFKGKQLAPSEIEQFTIYTIGFLKNCMTKSFLFIYLPGQKTYTANLFWIKCLHLVSKR